YKAVSPDHRAVQDNGLYSDQRAILDGTAVQHGLMPYCHVPAYGKRATRIGMQNRTLLDIGPFTDHDGLVIPANDRTRPDAAVGLQGSQAYNGSFGGDERGFMYDRRQVAQFIASHC